jgi:hypothetical protein
MLQPKERIGGPIRLSQPDIPIPVDKKDEGRKTGVKGTRKRFN